MSTPESVTCVVAPEITITVPTPPPLITVVLSPAPRSIRLLPMVKFSIYVAAATLTVSPDAASEMACPMVLQAVVGDLQLLLSFPLTPFTYHVVVAMAVEVRARTPTTSKQLVCLRFTIFSFLSHQLRCVGTAGVTKLARCEREPNYKCGAI